MSNKEKRKVRTNLNKYRTQRGNYPPALNHVVYNFGNTAIHELVKATLGLKAGYGLEVEINPDELYLLNKLGTLIENDIKYIKKMQRMSKNINLLTPMDFICEPVRLSDGKRLDFVTPLDNQTYEVVNTHESPKLLERYKREGVIIIRC